MAATIPILSSFDFDVTASFYSRLGFEEVARYAGEYLVIRNDDVELHFWHDHDLAPGRNQSGCYVRFDSASEARSLHEQWAARELPSGELRPPVVTDYGLLEFALLDPDRNLIRVGGVLEDDAR